MKPMIVKFRPWVIVIILQVLIMIAISYIFGMLVMEKQVNKTMGQFLYEAGVVAEQMARPPARKPRTNR